MTAGEAPLREQAVVFGDLGSLVGVVTAPAPCQDGARKTAAILLNAGILHRVGPNRLYVTIARSLARVGLLAMRFDFSGLGDSGVRRDKLKFESAAMSETVAAMDFLRGTHGVDSFLLIGLCSGADLAFRTAAVDPRVRGLGLIDFYYQPTLGYYLGCYRSKLLKGLSWRRLIGGRSSFLQQVKGMLGRFTRLQRVNEVRTIPEKADAVETLRALAARSCDLFFVFSKDGPAHYHYRRSFERPATSLFTPPKLRAEVIDETDHVFTPLASQQRLVKALLEWAEHVVGKSGQPLPGELAERDRDRPPRRARRLVLRTGMVGLGLAAALVAGELALRLWRERDRFYPLPPATTLRTGPWDASVTPGIEGYAYCATNSFGCRGPEPRGEQRRLLTVGGSTCICTGLDDTEAWPQRVMDGVNERVGDERFLWVTSSGLSGRSSRHHIMHAKYLVPRIGELDHVLFYCGLNDVGKWVYEPSFDPDFLDDPQNWNDTLAFSFHLSDYTATGVPWYQRLELWRLYKHVQLAAQNAAHDSRHEPSDGGAADLARLRAERQQRLAAGTVRLSDHKMTTFAAALRGYEANLRTMVQLVREQGAEPIFMAQFTLCGDLDAREQSYYFSVRIDGADVYLDPDQLQSFIDAHNDVMRQVTADCGVVFIDLPALMTGDFESEASFGGLFHDGVHFSERGSRLVASRVADFLVEKVYRR